MGSEAARIQNVLDQLGQDVQLESLQWNGVQKLASFQPYYVSQAIMVYPHKPKLPCYPCS